MTVEHDFTSTEQQEHTRRASTQAFLDKLCAVNAMSHKLNPIGYSGRLDGLLAVEMPGPWGDALYERDPAGTLPQRIRDVQHAWIDRLRADDAAAAIPPRPCYGIAPDPDWSRPDRRRVLLVTRPDRPFAQFDLAEYVFDAESPRIVELAAAFFEEPEHLADFDDHRVDHTGHRELLVCTHGQVDVCCARFGMPLYRQAREAYPLVRAWKTTHFGGHQFAPTAWEFPSGYKWAFLDEPATAGLIEHDPDVAVLAPKLRGWSGVPPLVQILDRVGFERYGWAWTQFERHGEVVDADAEAKRWQVRLTFRAPDGSDGTYDGTVIVGREVPWFGCGRDWHQSDHQFPVYALESFVEHRATSVGFPPANRH